MKERFREKLGLGKANVLRLQEVNAIIREYQEQGYKLTLRQLYYQLVSRDIVANEQKEYMKLSSLLVKGRMAGEVDWDAIEDRTRVPFIPYWVVDIEDAINDTVEHYRLNRQQGQDVYIEQWVEKDALSGVLRKITSYYHVRLMVNRGYSSCTSMHNAFERLQGHEFAGRRTYILYLGDHDPSGLDMIRDIRERLEEFGVNPEVRHIGLTREQIEKYDPPPNPAKITDPRADWYISEFGETSWEVDALDPKVLNTLVKGSIEDLIDMDLFKEVLEREESEKEELRKIAEGFAKKGEEE